MKSKIEIDAVAVPSQPCVPSTHSLRRRVVAAAVGAAALTYWGLASTRDHELPPALQPATTAQPDVCLTPACVHAASEILYNLSPEYQHLDPCSNFQELVCGGWRDRHDLRPDQGDAFTGTIMAENSQLLLRHILEAPFPGQSMVRHCLDLAVVAA
jgi:endothelin-converting enzyme